MARITMTEKILRHYSFRKENLTVNIFCAYFARISNVTRVGLLSLHFRVRTREENNEGHK